MQLLHRSSMVGGGCGGGRALRRVDSSPRPSLCRSDAMKKKKRSKRSRLSAALRELKAAARDKDGLLHILVTGHRASRRGAPGDGHVTGGALAERGAAGTGAEQRALAWRQGGGAGADDRPSDGGPLVEFGGPVAAACGRGRRCASWAPAAALLLALACVVALGTAPAICCCTCAAWLCGRRGAREHDAPDTASCHGRVTRAIVVQPHVGNSMYHQADVAV